MIAPMDFASSPEIPRSDQRPAPTLRSFLTSLPGRKGFSPTTSTVTASTPPSRPFMPRHSPGWWAWQDRPGSTPGNRPRRSSPLTSSTWPSTGWHGCRKIRVSPATASGKRISPALPDEPAPRAVPGPVARRPAGPSSRGDVPRIPTRLPELRRPDLVRHR